MSIRVSLLLVALAACHGDPLAGQDAGPILGPEVLWSSLPGDYNLSHTRATKVVLDDDNVYWLVNKRFRPGTVFKRAKKGGPIVTVTSGGDLIDLAVQGDYVYWTDAGGTDRSGSVMRAPKVGGAPTTVVSDRAAFLLAVDTERVFWTAAVPRTCCDGCWWDVLQLRSLQLTRTEVKVVDTGGYYDALALDDQFVYWSRTTSGGTPGIQRVAKAGGTATTVVPETTARPIAVAGSYLYYLDDQLRFLQLPLSGGKPRVLSDTTMKDQGFAIVGRRIYAAAYLPEEIAEVSIDTGAVNVVDVNLAPDQINRHDPIFGVAADSSYIYWTRDHGDQSQLVRAPHPSN